MGCAKPVVMKLDTQPSDPGFDCDDHPRAPKLLRTIFVPLQRGSSLDENRERVRAIMITAGRDQFSELNGFEATDIRQ